MPKSCAQAPQCSLCGTNVPVWGDPPQSVEASGLVPHLACIRCQGLVSRTSPAEHHDDGLSLASLSLGEREGPALLLLQRPAKHCAGRRRAVRVGLGAQHRMRHIHSLTWCRGACSQGPKARPDQGRHAQSPHDACDGGAEHAGCVAKPRASACRGRTVFVRGDRACKG